MADPLLIGIDGGATESKAHAVSVDSFERPTAYALRPEAASRVYERLQGFTPVPVAEQLRQRDAGAVELSSAEIEQGRRWVSAAADATIELAGACDSRRVLIGMGMPGLKTPDGRGIGVINNGPRMPRFLDEFEQRLADAGVELVRRVSRLGSDADYCGLGEEHAADGLFRDVQHAYYAGCGTGIADALKLRGELVPLDNTKPWLLKSWQIPSSLGPTFEKLVSAGSLNRVWTELSGNTANRTGRRASYPEDAAHGGDPRATAWLAMAAALLAELIFERLFTIHRGRPEAPHRGDAYAGLTTEHPYRGVVLDRVVLGQRLGLLFADPSARPVFAAPLEAALAAFIAQCDDPPLTGAWLQTKSPAALQPGRLRASKLRAAPALGAAVAAVTAIHQS